MKRHFFIAFLTVLLLIGQQVIGQYSSPFNGRTAENDSSGTYSFFVSGHFYGDGGNKSRMPANTVLANMDLFNGSEASMLVCLGDLFKDISNDIPSYETVFFDRLEIPLINSVGNHDLTGEIYQENYGNTYFKFDLNGDAHIVLDTELDNGDIEGEQLKMLKDVADKAKQGEYRNVFIYTHRTIWKDAYSEMDGLFLDNTQSIGGTNFESAVLPVIKEMSERSSVFWFSGSLGTAPASFFYFSDRENNLKIIGTAVRALPRDAVLKVDVNPMGEVDFETISLTGETLLSLEKYDVSFWQSEVGEDPFNWKLIPYYMELMVTHRYFWYGFLAAISGILVFAYFRKRRRRKKA